MRAIGQYAPLGKLIKLLSAVGLLVLAKPFPSQSQESVSQESVSQDSVSQDSVTTRVEQSSSLTRTWRNKHPAKLFKCWGRPDEIEVFQGSQRGVSEDNTGSLGSVHSPPDPVYISPQERGKKRPQERSRPFSEFLPQTLEWAVSLQDRDLKLSFRQNVTAEQVTWRHHACSTEKMFTKLDSVSNSMRSDATFLVPPGVRMVRITKSREVLRGENARGVKTSIKGVRQVVEDQSQLSKDWSQLSDESFDVGNSKYFFVNPGDQFNFTVSWQTQSIKDIQFEIDFEIRLLGLDLCDSEWFGANTNGSVSSLVSSRFSKDRILNATDDYIADLACLQSPATLSRIYHNQPAQVLTHLLRGVSREYKAFEVSADKSNASQSKYTSITALAETALLQISRHLLTDLFAFCYPQNVFDFQKTGNEAIIRLPGYLFAARQYRAIEHFLNWAPIKILSDFVEVLELLQAKDLTYAGVANQETKLAIEALELSVLSTLHAPYIVEEKLNQIPKVSIGKASQLKIVAALTEAKSAVDHLENELRRQLFLFTDRNPSKVAPQQLRQNIEKYKVAIENLRAALKDDIKWLSLSEYMDTFQMQFTRDLSFLNNDLLDISSDFLATYYDVSLGTGSSEDLIQYKQSQELYERVKACLLGTVIER